ncbi:Hypothetical protein A7982_04799 [Minicystis rosea]|nr:Hypothetical protein A7982_04799 [Minicystis rosea]
MREDGSPVPALSDLCARRRVTRRAALGSVCAKTGHPSPRTQLCKGLHSRAFPDTGGCVPRGARALAGASSFASEGASVSPNAIAERSGSSTVHRKQRGLLRKHRARREHALRRARRTFRRSRRDQRQ